MRSNGAKRLTRTVTLLIFLSSVSTEAEPTRMGGEISSLIQNLNALNTPPEGSNGDTCEPQRSPSKMISDHMVDNLDCRNLTVANVLTFMSPEKLKKKFEKIGSIYGNFGIKGMSGHCWAITKAQRKALYLLMVEPEKPATRLSEAFEELKKLRSKRDDFLNLVRETIPDIDCYGRKNIGQDDRCDDASSREQKTPLRTISLNSLEEVANLIELSRAPVDKNEKMFPGSLLSETEWLRRNQNLVPILFAEDQNQKEAAKVRKEAAKLTRARLETYGHEIDAKLKKGEITEAVAKKLNDELVEKLKPEIQKIYFSDEKRQATGVPEVQTPIVSPHAVRRYLELDLIKAQRWTFHQASNLRFLGGARDRSISTNAKTKNELIRQLSLGRMPIINMRFSPLSQHILLVQSQSSKPDGSTEFKVYDSNEFSPDDGQKFSDTHGRDLTLTRPTDDPPPLQTLIFSGGRFSYLKEKSSEKFGSEPVGIFMTDDDQMDEIQNAVYEFYHRKCSEL